MRNHHSFTKFTRIITLVLFISVITVVFYATYIFPHILQTSAPPFRLHNRDFIGTWYSHGNVLTIKQDGHAHFTSRVYRWCTEGPPPCDTMEGDKITPGIQQEIVFYREQDNTLHGTITSSTDHTDGQTVTVKIGANNTLDLNGHLLCGPKAPPGHCGA